MNYLSAMMSGYLQTIHQLKEMDSPAQFRALTRAFKSYNPLATNFFNIPPNITNHPLFKNNPTRQTFLCGKDDNGDTLLLAAVKEAPNTLLPLLAFRIDPSTPIPGLKVRNYPSTFFQKLREPVASEVEIEVDDIPNEQISLIN